MKILKDIWAEMKSEIRLHDYGCQNEVSVTALLHSHVQLFFFL